MSEIRRRFTTPGVGVIGTPQLMVDDESLLVFFNTRPNVILDVVNDPDAAAGDDYTIQLLKGGIDTGQRFYSNSLSAALGLRVANRVTLSGGAYQLRCVQNAGVAAVHSIILRLQNEL
jgi:hypothetical protein